MPYASNVVATLRGKGEKECGSSGYLAVRKKKKNGRMGVKKLASTMFSQFISHCQTWRINEVG